MAGKGKSGSAEQAPEVIEADASASAETQSEEKTKVEGAKILNEEGQVVAISADAEPQQVDQAIKEVYGGPDVKVVLNPDGNSKEFIVPDFLGQGRRVFRRNRAEWLSDREWAEFRNSPFNRTRDGRQGLVKGGN